jgi:hypothetical protein
MSLRDAGALLLTLGLAGCVTPTRPAADRPLRTAHAVWAHRATTPDHPAWELAPVHTLTLDQTRIDDGRRPVEPGHAQFTFDDEALYLRVRFTDDDLVCTTADDGDPQMYLKSDTAEWFIGTPPTIDPRTGRLAGGWYLELHVSPAGRRAAVLWLRPGLPQVLDEPPFSAQVHARGTLNDHHGHDHGWDAVFTLPWDQLRRIDPTLGPHRPHESVGQAGPPPALTTLVSRYNYGHRLPRNPDGSAGPELTMFPTQPRTQFHLRPFHARLREVPASPPVNPSPGTTP